MYLALRIVASSFIAVVAYIACEIVYATARYFWWQYRITTQRDRVPPGWRGFRFDNGYVCQQKSDTHEGGYVWARDRKEAIRLAWQHVDTVAKLEAQHAS